MAVNRGKQFEEAIEEAFKRVPNTSVTRLIDPQAGYAGVRNICDYVVYHKPTQYFIECKSVHGNTLSINSNGEHHHYGDITDNQWEGLLQMSQIDGVVAGVMVWFIDHDITWFVPIEYLEGIRENGAKSLNVTKYKKFDHFFIVGVKKRILFDYDMRDFIENYNDHFYA